MRKLLIISMIIFCSKSLFPNPPIGTYILFQPNSQISFLHILNLDSTENFTYYEFTIYNEKFMSVSLSDSVTGTWCRYENNIYLYSNLYLEASPEIRTLYQIMPSKSLMGDSLHLTIIDECTLGYPGLYRKFRCVNSIIPNNFDKELLSSIIFIMKNAPIMEHNSVPDNSSNK